MFKRILRWRLRRKWIDPSIIEDLAFSEWDALRELLKPSLRTYVTPEMVEILSETPSPSRQKNETEPLPPASV
jgi:hypothetical protein